MKLKSKFRAEQRKSQGTQGEENQAPLRADPMSVPGDRGAGLGGGTRKVFPRAGNSLADPVMCCGH